MHVKNKISFCGLNIISHVENGRKKYGVAFMSRCRRVRALA